MPDAFYKHVKQLKRYAYIQMLVMIVAIIACGLAIEVFSSSRITSVYLIAVSVISFLVFFFIDKIKKNCPDIYTATVSVNLVDTIENTLSAYQADKIANDSYVCFCSTSKFQARILILLADEFQADMIKRKKKRVNHAINQKYNISQEISISDSYAKLRINLLIVHHDCNDLHNWVSKNTAISLRRAEPTINAAIVLDEKELLFPSLQENIRLNELNKYLSAAEILVRIFCS